MIDLILTMIFYTFFMIPLLICLFSFLLCLISFTLVLRKLWKSFS